MGTNAARHLNTVINNTRIVLSIELLCALQALEFRTSQLSTWIMSLANSNGHITPTTEEVIRLIYNEFGWRRAAMFFPNWEKLFPYPIDKESELDNKSISLNTLFDVNELQISPAIQKVMNIIRKEANIPFIGFDDEANHTQSIVPTFRIYPLTEIIQKVSRCIQIEHLTTAIY